MKRDPVSDRLQSELDNVNQHVDAHDDTRAFLENSASWADTVIEEIAQSRRKAWRVAAGACGLSALFGVITLTTIAKSYQPAPPPEILRVDTSTGQVDRLVSLTDFRETMNEATVRRAIATFIRARESYHYSTAADHYFDAAAFMSPQMQAQWGAFWDETNPNSPMNLYKKDGRIRVEIGSISINRAEKDTGGTARVTFTRHITRNDIPVGPPTHWLATLSYQFINIPTQERTRRVNDLGFEVISYEVDADLGPGNTPVQKPNLAPGAPAAPATPQALTAPQAAGSAQ